jgi:uncharacterized protein with HEPN domain
VPRAGADARANRTRSGFALSERRDVNRLADMRAALADIRTLTEHGKEAVRTDRVVQQALAYNLAVLGEGARALSQELRDRYPDIPWRAMIAQRNVVVHEYHRIDFENIWTTATQDVPLLDQLLSRIETAERMRS